MSNLVGNAPNQVPTNADLGDLAYQDADYVRVGDVRVDGTITANTIISAGADSVTISSNLSVASNLSVTSNLSVGSDVAVTSNLSVGSDVAVTGNIIAQGNIDLAGSINMSAGNIFLNTNELSTSANAVVTRGYLDAQLIVFGF